MFGITKKTLEHLAVPRLNEHPKTNIKMAFAPGHRFFFRQNNRPTSYSLEERLHKANTTLGYSNKNH